MKFEIRRDGQRVTAVLDLHDDTDRLTGCCPEFIEIRRNGALVGQVTFNVPECQPDWEKIVEQSRRMLLFPTRLKLSLQQLVQEGKWSSKNDKQLCVEGFLSHFFGPHEHWVDMDEWPLAKKTGHKLAAELMRCLQDCRLAVSEEGTR